MIPFLTSSLPQAQQYREEEEVLSERFPSALFLSKDVWLLCNQCLMDDRASRERLEFLLATTKVWGHRGAANNITSLHPIQNSLTRL